MLMESDLAWAPTHTLTRSSTEVVDHQRGALILAAGMGCHRAAQQGQCAYDLESPSGRFLPSYGVASPSFFAKAATNVST